MYPPPDIPSPTNAKPIPSGNLNTGEPISKGPKLPSSCGVTGNLIPILSTLATTGPILTPMVTARSIKVEGPAELNPIFNGLWEVTGPLIIGVPNQYLLVRPSDFSTGQNALAETFVATEEGTIHEGKLYHLTSDNPMIIKTDAQTWADKNKDRCRDEPTRSRYERT